MSVVISVITFSCITLIGVLGTYMVTGLTGLFSFGQASFMAIGGYVAGVLVMKYKVPFILALIIGIISGLLTGLLIGVPTIRLRRDYISLVTFGFGEAIIAILNNMANVTGGAMGLSGIPKYISPWFVIVSVIVLVILVMNFKKSKYGRQCIALRSDELAAKAMGINVNRIKLIAFLFASVITTYAGILYVFYTTYIDPSLFDWMRSAEWIIIIFVGGVNSLTGAIVSTFVLESLPELLRFASEWRIVIYCIIVLLIINFKPSGLFGEHELNIRAIFKRRGTK